MVRFIYFARLREVLDLGQEELALPREAMTVAEVRGWLGARNEVWRRELVECSHLCIAVNREYATDESLVRAGDEVGFFPPVTGG